jgi:hypothetical protein
LALRGFKLLKGAEHVIAWISTATSHVTMGIITTILEAICTKSTGTSVTGQGKAAIKIKKSRLTAWAFEGKKTFHNMVAGLLDLKLIGLQLSQPFSLCSQTPFVLFQIGASHGQ